MEKAEDICRTHEGKNSNKFYIEDQMLQGYVTQQLKDKNIDAIGVPIRGKDKRTRLELAAPSIYNKKIYFPRTGCEELLQQILFFGVESHDDLVDAFTTLILGMIETPPHNNQEFVIVRGGIYGRSSSESRGWGPGRSSSFEISDRGISRRY
jgi:predicted phage terminase large subunit-like protein